MLRRIDHVGLIVPDIRAALDTYAASGARVTEPGEPTAAGYLIGYAAFENTRLEVIQPLTADSVAGRFLAAHPQGGMNHVAWEVDDLEASRDALVAQGARDFGGTAAGPAEPRTEPDGTRLLVVDATATHGTLIELRQPPAS